MTEASPPPPAARGGRTLLTVAAVIVVIAGLRAASDVILPFLLALFLAMISLPLLHFLQRKGLPSVLAVLITVLTELLVLAVLGLLVGGSIQDFIDAAPRYQARLEVFVAQTIVWLRERGVEVSSDLVLRLVNPGFALNLLTVTLRGVAGVVSQTFLVTLIIIFVLFEAAGFPAKLEAAFGPRDVANRYRRIREEIQRYLAIKTLISMVTGLLVGLLMAALQIDFPVLWGLLAFLLNYIPNLGSILAAIPPVLVALIQHGVGRSLAVAVTFVVINVVLGNLVEPQFMGRRLGLSTLVVFLSLLFWGWVWGPLGMLLSVPLTMILKITLENTEDLRWVAVLLDRPPAERR